MSSNIFWMIFMSDPRDSASGSEAIYMISFAIPFLIPYIALHYRQSGMEDCVIPRKADITVLEQKLKIAEKNLTRAEKGQGWMVLLMWIMVLSTIYFILEPEQFDYDSVLGKMGLPLSVATLIILNVCIYFLDENPEQAKVNEIWALIRKEKSNKRRRTKRKEVATEEAEYKTKQLEKAINLKEEGGIENLEKALEILKNYE
jgi:hypothetical protein